MVDMHHTHSRPGPAAFGLVLLIAMGACAERYKQPISLTPHGAAFRANMAAQIIDPRPPAVRYTSSSAHGPVRAVTAYRIGEVKQPATTSTTPSTSAQE